jgi:hypothetical protein
MSSRDTFFSISNSIESKYFDSLLSETLLVNVEPIIKDFKSSDRIEYDKINNNLNILTLREIVKSCKNMKVKNPKIPTCFQNKELFSFKHPDHEAVYISKKTWRVKAEHNNEDTQRQCFMLLRFLAKFGYVENYHRIQRKFNSKIVTGWIQ